MRAVCHPESVEPALVVVVWFTKYPGLLFAHTLLQETFNEVVLHAVTVGAEGAETLVYAHCDEDALPLFSALSLAVTV